MRLLELIVGAPPPPGPDSTALWAYMQARRIGTTDVITAPADAPEMLLLQQDGFVDRIAGEWIARGPRQPGEQRVVRLNGRTRIIGD